MATENYEIVLGLPRTGLIFTGIQEGTQPSGLTPTWPNRAGYSIPCAAMLGSGGGELGAGTHSRLRRAEAAGRGEQLCCAVCFVLCIPLFCIVVVPVPLVCCSVKLPLSRPTSFCLFLFILLRTLVWGGAASWRFCCWPQPNHNRDDPDCVKNKINRPVP